MRATTLKRTVFFILTLVGLGVLASCGGGGGGASGGSGGGTTPGGVTEPVRLTEDFYPLSTGDRRSWRVSLNGSTFTRHERVAEAVGGGALRVLSDDSSGVMPPEEELLQRGATALVSTPGPAADPLTRAVGPIEVLRFGMAQGQSQVLYDKTVSVDIDGDGRNDSLELKVESEFLGIESTSTAAGGFLQAAKVRSTARSTVRSSFGGRAVTIVVTSDDWFVSGIGLVRSSTKTVTDGVEELETSELVAYGVGAKRSDQVAPTVLLAEPANGTRVQPDARFRLEFSEPLDPLSLSGEKGIKLFRDGIAMSLSTVSLSIDGKILSVSAPDARLPDGRYELRNGGQVSDWAGNPTGAVLTSFFVDTTGPRLVSSTPASGAQAVPLTGTFELSYDESLYAAPGQTPIATLIPEGGGESQTFPVKLQGTVLTVTVDRPLQLNRGYTLVVSENLVDVYGNPRVVSGVQFRTDPGPLGRPEPLADGTSVEALALGDIDGDSRPDVVFAGRPQGGGPYFVGVRRQQADGRFAAAQKLQTPSLEGLCGVRSLAVSDVDGDGRADLLLRGECWAQGLIVLLQRSPSEFTAAVLGADPTFGDVDSLTLSGGVSGFVSTTLDGFVHRRRLADGTWQTTPLASSGGRYIAFWRLADLNGDGQLDLIWLLSTDSGYGYELAWSLCSAGSFGATQTVALPSSGLAKAITVSDFTGDGRPDLVIAINAPSDGLSSDSELWVSTQTPSGSFNAPTRLATDWGASALAAGDLNGDGRPDLVVAHDSRFRTGVFIAAQGGGFEPERLFESSNGYFADRRSLMVLDLNGDGRKDILQAGDVLHGRAWSGAAWPVMSTPVDARRASVGKRSRATSALLRLSPNRSR